ncbi:MAG TPA: P1 family peptidase [Symbiobacteriaceae bacterium]|nr:P1 family peptidase [Symbiobacteriaceae bacterium]
MHYPTGPLNAITDVPGILVGHVHDLSARTGCTAILAPAGATVGVAVEGSAPGTRETDLCRPGNLVQQAHGIMLCGGSAFGLAAADGAMRYLAEQGIGFPTKGGPVPIVPAAVLYDLEVGDGSVRPDAAMGWAACAAAATGAVAEGAVGAGAGCTAGKLLGAAQAARSGIGTASVKVGAVIVGAIVAVNPFGEVRDPASGAVLAGPAGGSVDTVGALLGALPTAGSGQAASFGEPGTNTTIGVVAVGGRLSKEGASKVARMAHNGLARTIFPVHTMYDGDALFCLATGEAEIDVSVAGLAASIAVELAVVRAVQAAQS